MRFIFSLLLILCYPLVVEAQLIQQPPLNINYVTNGWDYSLHILEADPTVAGKEVLVFLPAAWVVSIGRYHPTKHGISGQLPGAGLCIEPWTNITPNGPVWHYNTIGDANGDGKDDFIIYFTSGQIDVYQSNGLNSCR